MVLKRGVQVGLGQMPGIAGVGKQAQVGQPQRSDQRGLFVDDPVLGIFADSGVHEQQNQHNNLNRQKPEKQGRLSHNVMLI